MRNQLIRNFVFCLFVTGVTDGKKASAASGDDVGICFKRISNVNSVNDYFLSIVDALGEAHKSSAAVPAVPSKLTATQAADILVAFAESRQHLACAISWVEAFEKSSNEVTSMTSQGLQLGFQHLRELVRQEGMYFKDSLNGEVDARLGSVADQNAKFKVANEQGMVTVLQAVGMATNSAIVGVQKAGHLSLTRFEKDGILKAISKNFGDLKTTTDYAEDDAKILKDFLSGKWTFAGEK